MGPLNGHGHGDGDGDGAAAWSIRGSQFIAPAHEPGEKLGQPVRERETRAERFQARQGKVNPPLPLLLPLAGLKVQIYVEINCQSCRRQLWQSCRQSS